MKTLSLLGLVLLTSTPVAQDVARIVRKDGAVIVGTLKRETAHAIELLDAEGDSHLVSRRDVRALFRNGTLADAFAPTIAAAGPARDPDDDASNEEVHLRWIAPRGDAAGGLETKTSRWWHAKSGSTVLLVGVVHIGDPDYFQAIQRILDSADRVLFEGVGRSEMSDSDLASLDVMMRMQLAMRGALGLGFQSDHVDYARDFWVNSDVDFAQLRAQLDERRAQLPTDHPMMKRILGTVLRAAGDSATHRSRALQHRAKLLLGPSLSQADTIMQQPAFRGMRGAIIEDRNAVVMRDLERELAESAKGRWIAVFYGAGHMPDFVRRFEAMGLEFQESRWQRAWNVPAETPQERIIRTKFDGYLAAVLDANPAIESAALRISAPGLGESYSAKAAESAAPADGLAMLVETIGRGDTLAVDLPDLLAKRDDDRVAAKHSITKDAEEIVRIATAGRTRANLPRRDGSTLASLTGLLDAIVRRDLRGYSLAMHEDLERRLSDSGIRGSQNPGVILDCQDGRVLDFGIREIHGDLAVDWAISSVMRSGTAEAERARAVRALREAMLSHFVDALR